MRPILASLLCSFLIAASTCFGATKVWISTNGDAGLWSDGANWQGGTPPVSGDRVAFLGQGRNFSTNDIPNLALEGIDFGWFHLVEGLGMDLTGAAPITVAGGQNNSFMVWAPLRFTAPDVRIDVPVESTYIEFDGQLTFAGGTATINAPNTEFRFWGPIVDENPVSLVINARQLTFGEDNNFRGTLTYTGFGGWLSTGARGLGASTAGSRVEGDTAFYFGARQPSVIDEPLDLRMVGPRALFSPLGSAIVFSGPVAITGSQLFAIGTDTTFAGPISGDGRIIVATSPYPMTLASSGNSFSGGLQVKAATVHLAAAGVVPHAGELVIESGGVVDFASFTQSASRFSCAGTMSMGVGAVLSTDTAPEISGCTLHLAYPSGYVAPDSDIHLIDNANNSPVVGTFNGLPEGSVVMVNGAARYLTYIGGDGNEVMLRTTLTPPPPPPPPPEPPHLDAPPVQGMWWSPIENGWGMSVVQHGNRLFTVVYAYDELGKPVWYVMPTGTWNANFTRYAGDLYSPHGSPFFQYEASQFAPGLPSGSMAITFDNPVNPVNAVIEYSIGGVTGHKLLTPQAFGRGTGANAATHADMWWGSANQNGWGVAILQQGDTLFNVWFTYDAAGSPTWFVMPGGTWTSIGSYEGRIYRTLGSPWVGRQYEPSQLQVFDAGPYRLRFDGDNATLDYAVDGRSGVLRLDKQPF